MSTDSGRISRNHIRNPVDKYNELVDFIEELYQQVYPDETDWQRLNIFEMLVEIAHSASYEKQYNELLAQNLREGQARSKNLLESIFTAANLMVREDLDDSQKEHIDYVGKMLNQYASLEGQEVPSNPLTDRFKILPDHQSDSKSREDY